VNSAKARQNSMAVNQYKRGELFRRYHLQNIDNNAIEESSEGVDSALVESYNQADLPVLDEVEVVPVRSTKRKASSDKNIGESKSARKLSKKPPKVKVWTPERVELNPHNWKAAAKDASERKIAFAVTKCLPSAIFVDIST